MKDHLTPIAAIDILPDGSIREITEPWPEAGPGEGAVWRWLHCDRTSKAFAAWSGSQLPQAARSGLLQSQTRPRCDQVDGGLAITLRAVNMNPRQRADDMVAVRLWLHDGLIVSTRHRRMFVIDELLSELRTSGRTPMTPGAFVTRFAERLTARIESVTAERTEQVDKIEENMLDEERGRRARDDTDLLRVSRSVIALRRHIAPQREALTRLASAEADFIAASDRYELREIANRTMRTVEELDHMRERLMSLRDHREGLQSAQIARNGFVLSVVAAIFMPLSFLAGIFGMNLAGIPGSHLPWAFAAVVSVMVLIGVGLWSWLRWRGWF